MRARPPQRISAWLFVGVVVLLPRGFAQTRAAPVTTPAAAAATVTREDEPVQLERVDVRAKAESEDFDSTGLGSYEQQLRDAPFSNEVVASDFFGPRRGMPEAAAELAAIATPSAVDLATGDSRVGLRGFPTPLLTNGFVRLGGIDVLNTARSIVIQGALVPVLGRGAPGGIQDYWTNRPRAGRGYRYEYSRSSLERQAAAFELNAPTVTDRAWHRVAGDWSRKTGPETFAALETRALNGALTWRHSSAASTLFSVDYFQLHGVAAPGLPEYRSATGQRIIGPYLPLAGFNSYGPDAGIRRRSLSANLMVDAQPHRQLALRAGVEAWWRRIEQDRFSTGLLNLATARFEGTREPLHSEQPQQAQVARVEATGRFSGWGAEHKLMLAASHTFSSYWREERALALAARNALPANLRVFNPAAPDFSRVPYRPESYNRILTDRRELTQYTALELSERAGLAEGRTVLTAGLRQDIVGLQLHDRRAGLPAAQAHVADGVGQLTYHLAANYQALPGRLLGFVTTSTAFNPSTRVDLRTGRIQGNETTHGSEAGVKLRVAARQLEGTAAIFRFVNADISRRNPLYGDPVADGNHTQPQLVAAGAERYTGGKLEGSWRPLPPLAVSLRLTYVRAITTASPDLPDEVGRQLTRFPPGNATLAASYGFGAGRLQGLSLSASWVYISDFVASYADRQRFRLDYPGYATTNFGASYSKRRGRYTHGFGLSVRNVFDADLLQKLARVGAEREFTGNYRLLW